MVYVHVNHSQEDAAKLAAIFRVIINRPTESKYRYTNAMNAIYKQQLKLLCLFYCVSRNKYRSLNISNVVKIFDNPDKCLSILEDLGFVQNETQKRLVFLKPQPHNYTGRNSKRLENTQMDTYVNTYTSLKKLAIKATQVAFNRNERKSEHRCSSIETAVPTTTRTIQMRTWAEADSFFKQLRSNYYVELVRKSSKNDNPTATIVKNIGNNQRKDRRRFASLSRKNAIRITIIVTHIEKNKKYKTIINLDCVKTQMNDLLYQVRIPESSATKATQIAFNRNERKSSHRYSSSKTAVPTTRIVQVRSWAEADLFFKQLSGNYYLEFVPTSSKNDKPTATIVRNIKTNQRKVRRRLVPKSRENANPIIIIVTDIDKNQRYIVIINFDWDKTQMNDLSHQLPESSANTMQQRRLNIGGADFDDISLKKILLTMSMKMNKYDHDKNESKETENDKIIYSSFKKKRLFERHFISIINKYQVNDNNVASLYNDICYYLKCYYLTDYNKLTLNSSKLSEIDTKIKEFSENKKLKLKRDRKKSKKILKNLKSWKCYECNIICQNGIRVCHQCGKSINPLIFAKDNRSETFTVDKPFGILQSPQRDIRVCKIVLDLTTIILCYNFFVPNNTYLCDQQFIIKTIVARA